MQTYEYYVNPTDYSTDNYYGAARTPTGGQAANFWYLPIAVYTPDTPGEYPVIVFSHGDGGDYGGVDELAAQLTAAGYIVVSPTHTDTTSPNSPAYEPQYSGADIGGYTAADSFNSNFWTFRADDIALALNFMQAEAASNLKAPNGSGLPAGSNTGYSMDLSAPVVAMGHSYGSNTVAIAGGAAVHDVDNSSYFTVLNSDLDAVISLSGTGINAESFFDVTSFDGTNGSIALPYLRMSGSMDLVDKTLADVGDRYEPYFRIEEDHPSTAWAVDIDGATHAQFVNEDGDKDGTVTGAEAARFDAITDAILNFVDYVVQGDTLALSNLEAVDIDDPANYDLNGGAETLSLSGSDNLYFGYDGNDSIAGNNGNDTLYGMSGNDTLTGNADNDILDGGTGADSLLGGLGDDIYFIDDAGDVVIDVTTGDVTYGGYDIVYSNISTTLGYYLEELILTGSADDLNADGYGDDSNSKGDKITGSVGRNVIHGWGGRDTLYGGDGNDTLYGDSYPDELYGGKGDDYLDGGDGYDTLDGEAGNDTLVGGDLGDTIIEYDTLQGGNDSVSGGTGNDYINAGVGSDTVHGDDDDDIINEAGHAADYLYGDAGNDEIHGDGDGDTVGGDDFLYGGADSDSVYGGYGNDYIEGGSGNDSLDGENGDDTMIGGTGNDTFVVDSASDVVTEASGEGTDLVESSITYTLGSYVENLTLTGTGNIDGTGNALANLINGNSGANTIDGGDGDDILNGGGGNDSLVGGAGVDSLDGGTGDDTMAGGTGDDVYFVDSAGDEIVEYITGNVDLVFSSVNYTLGSNLENLWLTGTATTGTGNTKSNVIFGNDENNTLSGLGGADTISGGFGDDTLYGGNNDDDLFGGDDDDSLEGGSGNDTLNGGNGYDVLKGSGGDDVFRFGALSSIGYASDTITDFDNTGEADIIDLSGIDAITGGSDNAFTFIGTSAFSSTAGELRYLNFLGKTYISGDVDGNGVGDFNLVLNTSVTLTGADFIL
ncbi:MAG: hypothetical protein H6923_09930 [Alphaproteobacteria bacterium]|nr:hypothetical protein [Alphaproteobacteria bacterium]